MGPFPRGGPIGHRVETCLLQHARCYQPSKGDCQGTLCRTKPAGQATAICSQESSAATRRPVRGRLGLAANAGAGQPATISDTLPFVIQDVDGAELFGFIMFLRIAHAPAQYVTDSSFVEQRVDQRGRKATEASTSAWADLWLDVWCEIDAWEAWATPTPLLKRCWLV